MASGEQYTENSDTGMENEEKRQRISVPGPEVPVDDDDQKNPPPPYNPPPGQRLPPLSGDPQFRNPAMMPQQGAGMRGSDTIISVPSDGGGDTRQGEVRKAGPGIISMPGDSVNLNDTPGLRHKSRGLGNLKPIEIVIYFMDKTGINLTVEDGQHATAGELFEMVMDEMKFPHEAREAFSLWLVSDLLEVQLKPDHVPFKLVCYWEELLEKYTNAMEDDRERDEPVLMFQKNVFFPTKDERSIRDPKLMYLFYHEAKEAVVDGRYPLELDEYDYLAGLQATIVHKGCNDNEHNANYYRNRKQEYYPEHLCRNKWSFPGFKSSKSVEQRLAESHQSRSKEFGSQRAAEKDDEAWRVGLYSVYLDFCRKLPFYGSAFFKGQIEHPGSTRLWFKTISDDPVYVAINTDGISVIDMDDVKFLLFLRYEDLSWEYAEPQDKDNPDCMPCLFLQFPAKESNGEDVTKLLQIFSREATLMDAMIDACVKTKKRELKRQGKDDVDGARGGGRRIIHAEGEIWKDFNKMCLATFDKSGRCQNYAARTPKPNP